MLVTNSKILMTNLLMLVTMKIPMMTILILR